MDLKQTLEDLKVARELVANRLSEARRVAEELEKTLEGFDSSIQYFSNSKEAIPSQSGLKPILEVTRALKKAPQLAVHELFVSNPEIRFKTKDISRHLKKLKAEDALDTENNEISTNFGYILTRLVKKGKIENVGKRGKPIYILKI